MFDKTQYSADSFCPAYPLWGKTSDEHQAQCNLKSKVKKKVVSLSYTGFAAVSNGNSGTGVLRDSFFNGKKTKKPFSKKQTRVMLIFNGNILAVWYHNLVMHASIGM